MSWTLVLSLSLGAYACKALGLLALSRREVPPAVLTMLGLLPPALLLALVVVQTVGGGAGRIVLDARLVGMLVAGFAVWRRAPFAVVVVAAAAATAILRTLT